MPLAALLAVIRRTTAASLIAILGALTAPAVDAQAQPAPAAGRAAPPAAGGESLNLPYTVPGGDGQQAWVIQRGGWLQQQGNMPVYAQGANVTVNNNGPGGNANRATIDKATGEIVVDGLQVGGLPLTRRIFVNKDEGYVRYIDVFRSRAPQEQQVSVTIQTSLNYGVNGGNVVNDPRKPDNAIGWVAPTGAGVSVAEVWAGKGSKVTPDVNWQQGNSFVQAVYKLTIPPNGQAAIVHLHATFASDEQAEQFTLGIREGKLLANVPPDVRKAIVNFRGGSSLFGDREILRGDESSDVIELRTGDSLRGTLVAEKFAVTTDFGRVELPAERVIGLLTSGAFRPRQLLITADGEMIGGTLEGDAIGIRLSSGQVTSVPLSQVARVGCRKRPGEPDESAAAPASRPMVSLRSGDRFAIEAPAEPMVVLTRFGTLALPPAKVASADLRSTETGVHVLTLTDGSRFGGLLQAQQMTLKLATTGQPVTLPTGAIAMLQLGREAATGDPAAGVEASPTATATLALVGGDVLVAPLAGQIRLDTLFDTLAINAGEVTSLAPIEGSGVDVQVTLWDQTVVSGQLRDGAVRCTLAGDLDVTVPLPLIEKYTQSSPRPSAATEEKIRALVADLGAEDFARREQAEAQLVALGRVVTPVLVELRPAQPLEAQQRIDSVVKKLAGR